MEDILIKAPELDLDALVRNIRREQAPERVYIFEHALDEVVREEMASRFALMDGVHRDDENYLLKRDVAVHQFIGMELMRVWLPGTKFSIYSEKWVEEHAGPIQEPKDIEKYDWPRIDRIDFSQLDWCEKNLPENMGAVHTLHVFEIVRDLMGFETMSYALFERPEFVEELCNRVGEFALSLTEHLCQYKRVAAIYGADDFGFKTSLLIDPTNLRSLFLPWHKRFAQSAHKHKKLFLMHSCGKLDEIMDDFIYDVKADAKHSFEDIITPITEAKRLWGDRIGLLGGLDVDFMARSSEQAIRERVRGVLDICMPGGGYCLGVGNWVTSYIPLDNYLVLLDEGRRRI
jgi:uroporphyrinogen decarboxylase